MTFLHISYAAHVGGKVDVGYAYERQARNAAKRMAKKAGVLS